MHEFDAEQRSELAEALAEVRALPELEGLRKGGHVRHTDSQPGFGCVARSFAAIYVLILVFEGPFDELLVKRAVAQALPTVERLVAAHDFSGALERLASLKEPVDAFFDGVMVMAEDMAVRANRLALLSQLAALFNCVADISLLA